MRVFRKSHKSFMGHAITSFFLCASYKVKLIYTAPGKVTESKWSILSVERGPVIVVRAVK